MKNSPTAGLLQDATLATLLCAFIAAYPTFNLMTYSDLSSAVVRTVALLGVLACLYGWILSNNVEHARKYFPKKDGSGWVHPDEANMPFSPMERYTRLQSHIRKQNLISALMLVPVLPYLITSLDAEEVAAALLSPAAPEG